MTDQEDYDLEVIGLPRGLGDPDAYGYPGQRTLPPGAHWVTGDKVQVEHHSIFEAGRFDDSDNLPDDPEQQDLEEGAPF